jgi:hypothetical protein
LLKWVGGQKWIKNIGKEQDPRLREKRLMGNDIDSLEIKLQHYSQCYEYIAMNTAKMPHNWWMIKKIWYLYTMELYSAIKKNEILSFVGKWIELENIILSEVSQVQRAKSHMFSLICGI